MAIEITPRVPKWFDEAINYVTQTQTDAWVPRWAVSASFLRTALLHWKCTNVVGEDIPKGKNFIALMRLARPDWDTVKRGNRIFYVNVRLVPGIYGLEDLPGPKRSNNKAAAAKILQEPAPAPEPEELDEPEEPEQSFGTRKVGTALIGMPEPRRRHS